MSMRDTLSNLFGRYSFGQHADQAIGIVESSATAAPDLPPAGCAADTSPLRVVGPDVGDRPAASTSRDAAGHPLDWDGARDDLAALRTLVASLADTCADAIEFIDHLDPTPGGLAAAAEVTDIDTRRR